MMDSPLPQTFFTVHERFAPLNIVLHNRVHLLSVTSEKAVFTEVDCDAFDVKIHPFLWQAQSKHAVRLIVIAVEDFYALAEKIDVSNRNVVWMFHTSRCGSTAWVQVFNSLPGWTAFSEPQAMLYSIMYGDHGHYSAESFSKTVEYKRIMVAMIKIHLRQTPENSSTFWKGVPFDELMIDTISELFPQHKMLMAYRDSLPSITSLTKAFGSHPITRYKLGKFLNRNPADDKWWFQIFNSVKLTNGTEHFYRLLSPVITKVCPQNFMEWSCLAWASKVSTIRLAIQNGVNIKSIKYDFMVQDKRGTVAKVFDYLGVSTELVDVACAALDFDSQAGVANAKWAGPKRLYQHTWTKDAECVKRCNMIFKEFNVPDLHSSFDLSNSI